MVIALYVQVYRFSYATVGDTQTLEVLLIAKTSHRYKMERTIHAVEVDCSYNLLCLCHTLPPVQPLFTAFKAQFKSLSTDMSEFGCSTVQLVETR